jgi:hypothetical protein
MDEAMLFADTDRIRDHVDFLRRERRSAAALCDHLQRARNFAPIEFSEELSELHRQAEIMERYFSGMGETLDTICSDLDQLSRTIDELIADSIETANHL